MNRPTTELTDWTEWRERCALGRCSPDTQANLREFAAAGFHGFLRRYVHLTNVPPQTAHQLQPSDPWHLFESHLTLRQSRAGKRYKDWIFARASQAQPGPALPLVEGAAGLLIRDTVREYLCHEQSPARSISLNQATEAGTSLQDLLPGTVNPLQEVEQRELERIAHSEADGRWKDLDHRERLVLLARALDLPLSDPDVETAAQCRKTTLSKTYRQLVQRLFQQLRAKYVDDDRESVLYLSLFTIEALKNRTVDWGTAEISCARLFLKVKSKGK
jgi:hypothetical protein